MRIPLAVAALALSCWTAQVAAGPHIGMKLACKRYGEAWNSGSRSALASAVTGDFYQQWRRLPNDAFAGMPRGGSGQVLSSSKGGGSGTVTVSTSQGVLTFVVVGGGFRWTVADIYKAGDDGQTVSLKEYLDVTMTAREFIADLKNHGGTSFYDSITGEFQQAFTALSPKALERIQDFLPDTHRKVKPYVQIGDSVATMRVQIPDRGPHEYVTFRLKRESGWRVDDYMIDSDAIKVTSFRTAMPAIAAVTGFRQFARDPENNDPATFTGPGELRSMLEALRQEKPFPLKANGDAKLLWVAEDGKSAQVVFPARLVHISMTQTEQGPAIENIWMRAGDRWAQFAHVMALQRSLKNSGMFAFMRRTPAAAVAPIVETSASSTKDAIASATSTVTENVSAVATESTTAALSPTTTAAVAAVETAPAATPAVTQASAAQTPAVQPAEPVVRQATYSVPSRREHRRWRRYR